MLTYNGYLVTHAAGALTPALSLDLESAPITKAAPSPAHVSEYAESGVDMDMPRAVAMIREFAGRASAKAEQAPMQPNDAELIETVRKRLMTMCGTQNVATRQGEEWVWITGSEEAVAALSELARRLGIR